MEFVKLNAVPSSREMLSAFGGYNANCRIGDGEFAAMENLCSDHYPLLASRGKPVLVLRRLAVGSLELDPALGPGGFRELSNEDLCRVFSNKNGHLGKKQPE